MELMICNHKNCTNTHKSETGFCYEHASDIDKQYVKPREKTFVEDIGPDKND